MALLPKLATTLRGYGRDQLAADALAGLIVGVVAVPLALAFGIASGVSPMQGLVTAVVGGFLVSALGGSRVQIAGPTGAFVVIVYDIVQAHGLQGLYACTLLAGVMLVAMGLSGMGALIKFIPYPVTTGFTSGIAVIIFSSQVKDLLGLDLPSVPPEFLEKWGAYAAAAPAFRPMTAAVSAGTLALLWLWPKVTRRVPAPIVALAAATAAVQALGLPVETIADRFGELPRGLPRPALPDWSGLQWGALLRPAATVALLAAIESLLSAVVADGMIGGRHRSDMELVAQGAANLASPLFGGIPVTGAIARTATNVKSGGRTPVAGIVHSVFLLLVLLFLGRFVGMVPLCALAAILVVVAYHMSEWHSFLSLMRAPRSDVAVLLTTFLLTVLVDLTAAVEAGMVLAAFLFMRRMAEVTHVQAIARELKENDGEPEEKEADLPEDVAVYEINGPFFFGAASKLGEVLGQIQKVPRVCVVRMRHVPVMDATGLKALEDFQATCRRKGAKLILTEVGPRPMRVIRESGKTAAFDRVLAGGTLAQALRAARELL